MIRAIAFDCFGVLLDDYGHNWVNQSALPEDVKAKLHDLFRKRDLGEIADDEAYYRAVGEVSGVDADVLRAREHGVSPIEPMLFSYIKNELAPRYEIYIASNASASLLDELLQKEGFNTIFKHVFVSSNMGVVKPQAGFYEQILAKVDIPAEEILFVDDRQRNVDGAVAAGMQGYCYDSGLQALKRHLEEEVLGG